MVSSVNSAAGAGAHASASPSQPTTVTASDDWSKQVNAEQMFRILDSLLPFEACLYHQVLPLALEGSRLRLGMVNLSDRAALDYVRKILAFMNYSLVPQSISSEVHHAALTAYLNYNARKSPIPTHSTDVSTRSSQPKVAKARHAEETAAPLQPLGLNSDANSASTTPPEYAPGPENSQPGLLEVEAELQPAAAAILQDLSHPTASHARQVVASAQAGSDQIDQIQLDQAEFRPAASSPDPLQSGTSANHPAAPIPDETFIVGALNPELHSANNDAANVNAANVNVSPPALPFLSEAGTGFTLPSLDLHPQHLQTPLEQLVGLAPEQLLHELLARTLGEGIGRLYFERQASEGRILWSQNGILQAAMDNLPVANIQAVVLELKRLFYLPMLPVERTQQVEIERLYEKHRLLLRLRVMPGQFGEEATLQVLRGAALRFYQQQQVTTISRDALKIAQDLQLKLGQLRTRAQDLTNLPPDQATILPAIADILHSVEQQLDALRLTSSHSSPVDSASSHSEQPPVEPS